MNRESHGSWSGLLSGTAGALLVGLIACPPGAQAFSSGSTGADGPFNPTCTPTPCTVETTLPESGVLNFTTVDVPAGVTATFAHNAANTPVTVLASGDVSIAGVIDVSGQDAPFERAGRGGPGGFDGGAGGNPTISSGGTFGEGAGGGGPGGVCSAVDNRPGCGGSFGTNGNCGCLSQGVICSPFICAAGVGASYGLEFLVPLIGGSGGGGGKLSGNLGGGGGGGGGAILIASSGTLTVSGSVLADGGQGACVGVTGGRNGGGGGSGGGIRLVATTVAGGGTIRASGGAGTTGCPTNGGGGGAGRVRLEAANNFFTGPATGISTGPPGPIAVAGLPTITIVSVDGIDAPVTPMGSLNAFPDVILSPVVSNPVIVNLQAMNIPVGTVLQVTVTPQSGSRTTVTSTALSGTFASSTASAMVTLPLGVSVIRAAATFATM
jgi:hypothetical protein